MEGENFNYAQKRSSYDLPSFDIHETQNFQTANGYLL